MPEYNSCMNNFLTLNPVGRPTVLTPDTVAKLVSVLQRGVSITKACIYARIDRATFYRKYNEDADFCSKIDQARNFATIAAAEVVTDDIVKNKNVQTAKWYLERKDPEEFAQKGIIQVNKKEEQKYYFMTDQQVKEYAKATGLDKINPVDLLEVTCKDNMNCNDSFFE